MNPIISPLMSSISIHAFFTREGGVSENEFASLNGGLASGDDPQLVRQNRQIALNFLELPKHHFVNCYQIHSATVHVVDGPNGDLDPRADAMITTLPGFALVVFTADCIPVFIADKSRRAVGVAHVGWRGGQSGLVANVVAAFDQLGVRSVDLVAAVGPSIQQRSYQVGRDVLDAYCENDASNAKYFIPESTATDKWLFDLPSAAAQQLRGYGIDVWVDSHDTMTEPDRFFSARRAASLGEKRYGRMMSVIALK